MSALEEVSFQVENETFRIQVFVDSLTPMLFKLKIERKERKRAIATRIHFSVFLKCFESLPTSILIISVTCYDVVIPKTLLRSGSTPIYPASIIEVIRVSSDRQASKLDNKAFE